MALLTVCCGVALQGHVSTIGVNQEQDSPLVGAGALHEANEAMAFPDLDTVDLVAVRCDIPSERVCQHSKSQSEARLTAGCWCYSRYGLPPYAYLIRRTGTFIFP